MKNLLLAVLLFNGLFLFSQSADRKVIASAGKDAQNGTGFSAKFMTYTIGEPLIYRGSNSTYNLSNGFIQPIGIFAIAPPLPTGLILASGDIAVYPNPFGTYLLLNGQEESEQEVSVQLIDQQGKLILQQVLVPHNYKLEIPQHCAPGTYFLNLYTMSGQFIQQNKLIKMDIESNNN
jgi:hypothetical protein